MDTPMIDEFFIHRIIPPALLHDLQLFSSSVTDTLKPCSYHLVFDLIEIVIAVSFNQLIFGFFQY